MMHPLPRSRIWGRTACEQRIVPYRLTSITSAYSSIGVSSATPFPPMPALLTNTSIPPAALVTSAIAAFTESVSLTSHTTGWTSTPASDAIAASFSPLSRLRIDP